MIQTERLTLRAPRMEDAASLAHHANDAEISRWLLALPHPYTQSDAQAYIAMQRTTDKAGQTYLICVDDAAVGAIGTIGEFGYWIGRAYWGQGLVSEAAHAILTRHFNEDGWDLKSSHAIGNGRSARVLEKCGFRYSGQTERRVGAYGGQDHMHQFMGLTHADWLANQGARP